MKSAITTKKELGQELKMQLDAGYDIDRISFWSFSFPIDDPTGELFRILNYIAIMGAGPEFEYTEQELRLLVQLLLKNDDNPIEKIEEKRRNRLQFD